MKDAKGRELKVGDRVLIAAEINHVELAGGTCNVVVDSEKSETISGLSASSLLRANPGDENGE